jgi:hypothetical protein
MAEVGTPRVTTRNEDEEAEPEAEPEAGADEAPPLGVFIRTSVLSRMNIDDYSLFIRTHLYFNVTD